MVNEANKYIVHHLHEVTAYDFFLKIAIVIAIIGAIIGLGFRAWQVLERYRKAINEIEKKNNLIEEHEENIDDLQEADSKLKQSLEEIHSQHVADMKDLQKVDDKLRTEFDRVYDKIEEISGQINKMQERNDSRERADIKSHISSLYQRFHEKQCWNYMEKEAMEDLIASYEECGGSNSFVHEVVQKEMYTWTVTN